MTDHSVLLGRISTDMPSQPEINPEATASFASIEHLKQMIRTGVLDLENNTEVQPEIEQIFQKFIHLESCGKCAPCREGTKRMAPTAQKNYGGQWYRRGIGSVSGAGRYDYQYGVVRPWHETICH